jgi:hypothetical protein
MKERQIYMKRTGKRMLAILLSMVLLLSGGASVPLLAVDSTAGDGKFLAVIEAPESGSIAISTAAELEAIRNNPSGKYHLTADIDLSGQGNWVPIGDSFSTGFNGVFDGQGHVIYGLTITGDGDVQYAGLFGYAWGAVIKNVGLEDGRIDVSSSDSYAGGLVGFGSILTISNSYNTGGMSGHQVGGLVGVGGDVSISDSYNTGDVSGYSAGGLVGWISSGDVSISDSYNTGDVSSIRGFAGLAGGLVGYGHSTSSVSISRSYNAGDVSAYYSAGGLIGRYQGGIIIEQSVVLAKSIQATGTNVSNYLIGAGSTNVTKTNNLARNDISGNATNDANTLLALSEFKKQSTYTGLGWNFATVWAISADTNNGYPYLQSIPPAPAAPDAPAALTGTATINNTAPRIGDTLTASLAGGNNNGALTYSWKAGGAQVQTGAKNTYTVQTADLGKQITVAIISSVQTGTRTSAATTAVAKKTAPAAPSAPTLASKTATGVTLTPNEAYEFRHGSASWQTSSAFTGLTPNTTYTFYQRLAETADTLASGSSAELSVTTDLAPATVTGVTVSPADIGVQAGGVQQFAATVTGTNNPSQDVTWSLAGHSEVGTEIDTASGLLTIDANEAEETILTVTATSTANPSISGTATVTVTTGAPTPLYAISLNAGPGTTPSPPPLRATVR